MTTSQAILSGDNRASNFALNEEQQAVLDQADRFARKELYPLSERMDREQKETDAIRLQRVQERIGRQKSSRRT